MNNIYFKPKRGWTFMFHLLLLSIMSGQLMAQDTDSTRQTSIGFTWGHHSIKGQDLLVSPLIYTGGGATAIGLSFSKATATSRFYVAIEAEQVDIESSQPLSFRSNNLTISKIPSEFTGIRLELGYTKRLRSSGPVDFNLGLALGTKISWFLYNLGLSDEDTYLLSTSISPLFTGAYQLSDKSALSFEVQTPLLSLATRPTFAIVSNEEIQHEGSDLGYAYGEGTLVTLDTYQAIDIRLKWIKQLSAGLDFSVAYRFDYARFSDPQTFSVRKSNIDLGLTLKL